MNWDTTTMLLIVRKDGSGIWEGFIPNVKKAKLINIISLDLKVESWIKEILLHILGKKTFTASIAWGTFYEWNDEVWMKKRKKHNSLNAPWSVYEVHLASWMRPDKKMKKLTITLMLQITERLVPYVKEMGFTHVEFMPVMEHPFDGSWGYQGTGFFAPTSRFGSPQDFAALIDAFHQCRYWCNFRLGAFSFSL
jgi:1,4-alpha-glucan branching enzyme